MNCSYEKNTFEYNLCENFSIIENRINNNKATNIEMTGGVSHIPLPMPLVQIVGYFLKQRVCGNKYWCMTLAQKRPIPHPIVANDYYIQMMSYGHYEDAMQIIDDLYDLVSKQDNEWERVASLILWYYREHSWNGNINNYDAIIVLAFVFFPNILFTAIYNVIAYEIEYNKKKYENDKDNGGLHKIIGDLRRNIKRSARILLQFENINNEASTQRSDILFCGNTCVPTEIINFMLLNCTIENVEQTCIESSGYMFENRMKWVESKAKINVKDLFSMIKYLESPDGIRKSFRGVSITTNEVEKHISELIGDDMYSEYKRQEIKMIDDLTYDIFEDYKSYMNL